MKQKCKECGMSSPWMNIIGSRKMKVLHIDTEAFRRVLHGYVSEHSDGIFTAAERATIEKIKAERVYDGTPQV